MSPRNVSPLRERVTKLLESRRDGATPSQVAAILGEESERIRNCIYNLKAANRINICGRDARTGELRYTARPPREKGSSSGLPMLVPGRERRTDCKQIGGCLDRWVASAQKGNAGCPEGCASYAPISAAEKVAAVQRRGEE